MSDLAELIADMVRQGINPDIIGRVAEAVASASSGVSSKTARQERNARYYANKRLKASEQDVSVTSDTSPSFPPKKVSPTPPSKNNPLTNPSSNSVSNETSKRERDEFERWYEHFPNKVGKGAAWKAWPSARKQASYEVLCGGLRRYLAKTDDRPWCNPATWLNQGRWQDEPAQVSPRGSPPQPNGKPRNIAEASARLVAQMKESTNANSQPRALSDRAEQDVPYLAAPNGQR